MAHKGINPKPEGSKKKVTYPPPLLYPDIDDTYYRSYEEQKAYPGNIVRHRRTNKAEKVLR